MLFYRLLLRGDQAQPGLGNKHYVLQWNRQDDALVPLDPPEQDPAGAIMFGEDLIMVQQEGVQLPAPRAAPAGHGHGHGRGAGRGRGGRGPAQGAGVVGVLGPPIPDPMPGPAVPAGAQDLPDEAVMAPPEPPAPQPEDAGPRLLRRQAQAIPWRAGIGGVEIAYSAYINPQGRQCFNWKIKCARPDHAPNCGKSRADIPRFCNTHGAIEPIAYLHVWHKMEWPTQPGIVSHARETPQAADVAAFVAEHGDALAEILREAHS